MRIGEVLRDARERADLDLRAAEAQTKIRLKYLRALEDEQWAELPSTAYAKGFLRTYAQLLGLDAETLVDEYRRQVEAGGSGAAYPLTDARVRGPRAPGERGRIVGVLVVLGVLAGLAAVALLAGGSGDEEPEAPRPAGDGGKAARGEPAKAQGPAALRMRVRRPVEVCLVGGGGEALIDRQVLAAGSVEQFTRRRFELRFPQGVDPRQLRLEVSGKPVRVARSRRPAAYAIVGSDRVRTVKAPAKEDCP